MQNLAEISQEKNHVFVEASFSYSEKSVALNMNDLRALTFLQEKSKFRFCSILKNCPYGSLGRMVVQESKNLMKLGLVHIVHEDEGEVYALTQEALTGNYHALMIDKKKIDV